MDNGQTIYKNRVLSKKTKPLMDSNQSRTKSDLENIFSVHSGNQTITPVTIDPKRTGLDYYLSASLIFVPSSNLRPTRKSHIYILTNHIGRPLPVNPPTASPCQQPPCRAHPKPLLFTTMKFPISLLAFNLLQIQVVVADSLI